MMNEHSGSQYPSEDVKQSDDAIANRDADCVPDDVIPAETTK